MRAPISMAHDNTTLTVSAREANRVEEDAKRRLLSSRRLTLVVDLDQTIIHATVDPTVGEWREDKDNPNHEAVREVRQFQLIDDGPGMRGCWYYIKLRPGLEEFLKNVAEIYELHIYTMGTRAYAQHIVDIIDPTRTLFGDRILSRDESGSLTVKDLQRLFPVDTKMVVIIDDRGDIWRWSPNLIKVSPYDFFVGIGDINSSFLPKKQDIGANKPLTEPKAPEQTKEHHVNDQTQQGTEVSALEQLVTMGGGDSPRLLQEQTDAQEETILHQVEDRPLLQKQKELDAEDNIENHEPSGVEEPQDSAKPRHHLLEDHDQELYQLQNRLEQVHLRFYEEYDKRRRAHPVGDRVAVLRGEKVHSKNKDVDLRYVPDVKDIMPQIKARILGGVVLVFSGVLPLGIDFQNADISLWAKSFGVVISSRINARTTHLVAGRNRTAKVREATRYPDIKIVTTQWLVDSLVQWRQVDEEPYLLPVHPDDRGEPLSPGALELEISMLPPTDEDITGPQWTQEEDAEDLFKSSGLDETSPVGYGEDEQAEVHDELKDFLGSDDESESDNEPGPAEPSSGTKRKRGDDLEGATDEEESGDDDGDEPEKGSRLSQRVKRSYERNTKLREITPAPPRSDEPPSQPGGLEGEESESETLGNGSQKGSHENPDDDEDDLERELLAAFESGENDSQEEDAHSESG